MARNFRSCNYSQKRVPSIAKDTPPTEAAGCHIIARVNPTHLAMADLAGSMPCADMAVGNSLPTPLLLGVDALAGIVSLRGLVREVAVNPTNPTVLFNFAATLERLGEKDHLAAVVYMRALDFETEGSKDWAECIAAMCAAQPASLPVPLHATLRA